MGKSKIYIKLLQFLTMIFFIAAIIKCKKEETRLDGIYILNLNKNEKHLIFYGSMHSFDPENPMFNEIENYFLELNPGLAFCEGRVRKLYKTRDETIVNDGEPGLLRYLTNEYNVLIKSIEPTSQGEYEYILDKYEKDSVYLMYFLRQVVQFQNQSNNNDVDFEDYFSGFLLRFRNDGFPVTEDKAKLDYVKELYKSHFRHEFDWETFDFRWIYKYNNILYDIHEDVTNYRDIIAVQKIEEALGNYDRIMVVMGSQHAKNQEFELKALFE